jgi:hypothetical protein
VIFDLGCGLDRLGCFPSQLDFWDALPSPGVFVAHLFTHLNQRERMVIDENRCASAHPRILYH